MSTKLRKEIKEGIVGILLANGESILDDHGVDEEVCNTIAEAIIDYLLELYEKEKTND